MVSDERCKEILNRNNLNNISNDDIKMIKALLSEWAIIEIEIEKEYDKSNTIYES